MAERTYNQDDLSEEPLLLLLHAIEWKTPFMVSLLSFHVIWLFLVIYSLYTKQFRIPVALVSAIISFFTDKMNDFMAINYHSFGLNVNIFDKSGLFAFIFMALPMAFYLFVFFISYFSELFISLKKNLQLREEIKQRRKAIEKSKKEN